MARKPVKFEDVEGKRLKAIATPKGTPLGRARVNLTWFARAMEDGESIVDALSEAYGGQGKLMAADIRILLVNAKGGDK
jgi:hypothetical protein